LYDPHGKPAILSVRQPRLKSLSAGNEVKKETRTFVRAAIYFYCAAPLGLSFYDANKHSKSIQQKPARATKNVIAP
jgi:hypothetical protein